MNTKWITGIVVAVIIVVVAVYFVISNDNNNINSTSTSENTQIEEQQSAETVTTVYELTGVLADVSESGSSGVVEASYFSDGNYELLATFDDLAPTTNGDFYEGWLVNRETQDFFSTGIVVNDPAGEQVNSYKSDIDHQADGYDFYVLTLEPDDGDPAPAEHIVEGPLVSEQ